MQQLTDRWPSVLAFVTASYFFLNLFYNFAFMTVLDARLLPLLTTADIISSPLTLAPILATWVTTFLLLGIGYLVGDPTAGGRKDIVIFTLIVLLMLGISVYVIWQAYWSADEQQIRVLGLIVSTLVSLMIVALAVALALVFRMHPMPRLLAPAILILLVLVALSTAYGIAEARRAKAGPGSTLVLDDDKTEAVVFVRGFDKGALFWSLDRKKAFFLNWEEVKRF